jgi:hypothetical protein
MTRSRLLTFLAAASAVLLVCQRRDGFTAGYERPAGDRQGGAPRPGKYPRRLEGPHPLPGKKSRCFGECAVAWPPLRASGKPTAGHGVHASLLGTTKPSDGRPQVTYNGRPLYHFQGDRKPGDTNGQGINAFGGLWWVVSASGKQVTGSGSTSGGGNGYSP